MRVLGLSFNFHDSAAAFVQNGEIIGAVQEERFSRLKHDPSFPIHSVNYLLEANKINDINKLDVIAFYENPKLKFNRILTSYIAMSPRGWSSFKTMIKEWTLRKLYPLKEIKQKLNFNGEVVSVDHHLSHAASSYFPSPFENSSIIVADGVGEWDTTSIGIASDNEINLSQHIKFPHSLGLLYSAFTYFLGFKVNSGEYKVMGLAPYGEDVYSQIILENLIDLKNDGSFRLNLKYFDHGFGGKPTNDQFEHLFKRKRRMPETSITQDDTNLARSIQVVIELAMQRIVNYTVKLTKSSNICLSGGVALNCVSNGKLLDKGIVKKLWIQPASGDSGGALGAALFESFKNNKNKKTKLKKNQLDFQKGSFLGPSFRNDDIEYYLKAIKVKYKRPEKLHKDVAKLISEQNIVGWFSGSMEFGPRALGGRSILADPRDPIMQKKLNLKIKFRESFRPFAPIVLAEKASKWFNVHQRSDYMLIVSSIRKEVQKVIEGNFKGKTNLKSLYNVNSLIPAVTHVDKSARVQTISKKNNPNLYRLLKEFNDLTSCPILVNTSFNIRGEPIVCNPEDAFLCFMRTNMDYLVLNEFLISKKEVKKWVDKSWIEEYELD